MRHHYGGILQRLKKVPARDGLDNLKKEKKGYFDAATGLRKLTIFTYNLNTIHGNVFL